MVNRNYKDTIFRMLFSDRENLLSLYNAINGTSYDNSEELEIVTLENAILLYSTMEWIRKKIDGRTVCQKRTRICSVSRSWS